MKQFFVIILFLSFSDLTFSQIDSAKMFADNIEAKMRYQSGTIKFENGIGSLAVPNDFAYLDPEQAEYVIKDLWGNPKGAGTLGMIVPKDKGVAYGNSWAFIITYDSMGHVKDDDADEIDYDQMLKDLKEDISKESENRVKNGFEKYELIGWAAKPYYDKEKKVLHWAKEIKFGESETNTLNYNIRVLGRKGVLVLNAVASIDQLEEVKKNINPILSSFEYSDGNKYSDFNPSIDEVAAWTIGGLVQEKFLLKLACLPSC
ncbi:MAG TPA: DUF2167 domain-containing protein [Cyclobacteriaceae bacterium]|jgi:uncharacterized membrane-anchored protein|nr:DUF2167 domain-containing protein [Cyclobacteriaceae bacterium]